MIQRLHATAMSRCFGVDGDQRSGNKLNKFFLIAALPTALLGIWNIGFQTYAGMTSSGTSNLTGWQQALITQSSMSEAGSITHFWLGLLYFIPLFVVSYAACRSWDWLFARLGNRSSDGGNLLVSFLFVLLLPATMPLGFAILGISFGVIFGKLIFGGNGRYLVNPSLLGVVFLYYSYPRFFNGQESFLPISGEITRSTWQLLTDGGIQPVIDAGFNWMQVFVGAEIGAIGTTSALASLVGLLLLLALRSVSWRVPVGAILGLLMASLLLDSATESAVWQIPWFWHLAVGSFAFSLAFIATDPTVVPLSRGGALIYGGIFGFLTLIIRVANPEHPEGTLLALLLASLVAPLVDWLVIEVHRSSNKRRRRPA